MLIRRCGTILIISLLSALFIQSKTLAQTEEIQIINWIEPVNGVITDIYGTRNGKHKGIDIAAPEGSKILSVDYGEVTKSYYSNSYGNVVFVKHENGYETVYAHLSSRNAAVGDYVNKGDTIGIIGNTGISTGTHLHFEVHKGEWTVNKKNSLDPLLVIAEDKIIGTIAANAGLNEEAKDKGEVKNSLDRKNIEHEPFFVKVQSGDTLWGLSQTYLIPIEEIKSMNKLTTNTIYVNQKIKLYKNDQKEYSVNLNKG